MIIRYGPTHLRHDDDTMMGFRSLVYVSLVHKMIEILFRYSCLQSYRRAVVDPVSFSFDR